MEQDKTFFKHGFSIIHIHRDRPPKLFRNMGYGYAFFSNDKYGDLALFIKLVGKGKSITEAAQGSGVSRSRGGRFLKVFSKYTGRKFFCRCGKQIPHTGNCKGKNGKQK